MDDEAERIRKQMQHVRQDLGADVQGIVLGAKQLSDWRHYVRQYPWACAGSAFALGILATPARRKLLEGVNMKNLDMQSLVEQLKSHGLAVANGAAPFAPGGLAGKLLAIAGPFLLRNAAAMVVQRFNLAGAPHPAATATDAGAANAAPHADAS